MKGLRTIRFDASDARVFDPAAEPGEWAIPGGAVFAAGAPPDGKERMAFRSGFLSAESLGWSTFVAVSAMDAAAQSRATDRLATHLIARFGAPDPEAARRAADAALADSAALATDLAIGAVLSLTRETDTDGTLREAFRVIDRPGSCAAGQVWQIVEADP